MIIRVVHEVNEIETHVAAHRLLPVSTPDLVGSRCPLTSGRPVRSGLTAKFYSALSARVRSSPHEVNRTNTLAPRSIAEQFLRFSRRCPQYAVSQSARAVTKYL